MVCTLKTILAVSLALGGVRCASAVASGADVPESQRQPPTLQLANGRVKVKATIWLPDAETGMYRGTRFDWSGIVAQVDAGGHRFFAPWQKPHNPEAHDHAQGIAEEFDLDKALGYEEVGPGGSFVKIGVGVLERASDKPYQFFGKYAILRAPAWVIEHGDDWVTFEQRLGPVRGWGYRYRKRIELTSDGLIVKRWLTNTGTNTIDLNHYGHNFFAMDGVPRIGSVYRVSVPFDLKLVESAGRTDQMLRIAASGRDLEFADQIQGAIWARFAAPQDADENRVTVTNTETGTSITVATDRPMTRFVVWGTGPVLCPETFVRIHLQPAESTSWTSRYTFVPG